jgi:two-component system OmpR family response regulator
MQERAARGGALGPRREASADEPARGSDPLTNDLGHVLLVDDDPDIRLIARLALARAGWRVDVAGSGDEALRAVAACSPDLVLLDMMLEGETGVELMRRLPADLPVVFLTARTDVAGRGAAGVIQKPFDPAALAGSLEQIWKDRPAPRT